MNTNGVVKTGIKTLDSLFAAGGYPENNSILVMGGPGSGKTIFGMQYLISGVKNYDEPGILLALQEKPAKIKKVMGKLGWDLSELENKKKIVIIDATTPRVRRAEIENDILESSFDIDSVLKYLGEAIKNTRAKRVVIDSLSMMSLYIENDFQMRTKLLSISSMLSDWETTSLIISEQSSPENLSPGFSPEAFMFDGLIHLSLDSHSQERRISIRKMRGGKHAIGTFRFDITDDQGIIIKP